MLDIIKENIRGGISIITHRYSKSNNIYMGELHDEKNEDIYNKRFFFAFGQAF